MRQITLSTTCGAICGLQDEHHRIFRGVPYARAERFELPEMITRWDGTLDATQPETDCPQYAAYRSEAGEFYHEEFRRSQTFRYDEAALMLTIITPPDPKGCPVLAFIHGGGHETGCIGEAPFGMSTEYARRGVILVSIGYRLNVFSLYRSRNLGLHDQMTALKWLHQHIADFGGDPSRITMMGQSAGAMSVMDLCYSQQLKGIVSGAVMMSGGGMVPSFAKPWTEAESAPFWDKVRQEAGAADEEALRRVPAQQLWEAWYKVSRENFCFQARQPGIDGSIIPDQPQKLLKAGDILDIPMLLGVTSQDFMPVVIYEMALGWGVRSHRLGRRPVWGYMFDHTPPGNRYKAFHAVDLWYAFGSMEQSWRPFTGADRALAAQMMDYIAQFARTGDPNGDSLPAWKPLSTRQKGFRHFTGTGTGHIGPWRCRKRMLRTQFIEKGPM